MRFYFGRLMYVDVHGIHDGLSCDSNLKRKRDRKRNKEVHKDKCIRS